ALEAGFARQLRGDVGQLDGKHRVHLDLAFFHAVAVPGLDVGPHPDPDAAADLAATDAVTEAPGEDHGESLLRAAASSSRVAAHRRSPSTTRRSAPGSGRVARRSRTGRWLAPRAPALPRCG